MTRRPVLPGAAELFRRTDVPPATAPVTELPTLAAAASSSALRGKAQRTPAPDDAAAPASALSLVPSAPEAPRLDDGADRRAPAPRPSSDATAHAVRRPTRGAPAERTKHQEKITVYCSADELLALEQARLTLRGEHGVVADRGRIVRTAIEVLLADLGAHGEDSVLVRRLRR